MTNNQTLEALQFMGPEAALEFHLQARHYPPVHSDFYPAISLALELANDGRWDATVGLPNGRVLSVASIIEQLHLEPFLANDDPWALEEVVEPETVTECRVHGPDCYGCPYEQTYTID